MMFSIDILSPEDVSHKDLRYYQNVNPLKPFSDIVVSFLDDLSETLRALPFIRKHADIAAFAFFCRKANILRYKKGYDSDLEVMIGRGLVFHVAPSNVPLNFAYSLVSSLLAGNSNIVRVSTKHFEQVDIVVDAINKLLASKAYRELRDRILLVRYQRTENNITEFISSICDIRIIWGGDQTINQIKKHSLSPQSFDITFADRTSVAILNSKAILELDSLKNLVQGFYNDTYLNDQNACTSSFIIVWYGDDQNIKKAKNLFWGELGKLVTQNYEMNDISSIDKLTSYMQHSIDKNGDVSMTTDSNKLWRVEIDNYDEDILNYKCNSGYFIEYNSNSSEKIFHDFSKKIQTLSYFGFEKNYLMQLLNDERPKGIDRIVPVGRTQDFSLIWDGYDLVRILTKTVSIA